MWLLVKSSFDINDHILSLFLGTMRQLDGILYLFVHPTHVVASVDLAIFTLLCLAECACIVERTSNVAYSSNVLKVLVT